MLIKLNLQYLQGGTRKKGAALENGFFKKSRALKGMKSRRVFRSTTRKRLKPRLFARGKEKGEVDERLRIRSLLRVSPRPEEIHREGWKA